MRLNECTIQVHVRTSMFMRVFEKKTQQILSVRTKSVFKEHRHETKNKPSPKNITLFH